MPVAVRLGVAGAAVRVKLVPLYHRFVLLRVCSMIRPTELSVPPTSLAVPVIVWSPVVDHPTELYAPGGLVGNVIAVVSAVGTATLNEVCQALLQLPAASTVST